MKKVILNLSAIDYGGAGKFTIHFNNLLRSIDFETYLVVKDVKTDYPYLIQYPKSLEKPVIKLRRRLAKQQYTEADTAYDHYFYNLYDRFSTVSAQKILSLLPAKPDVIFIHWVSDFINAQTLNELQRLSGAEVFILMLDNAPITGGCHYPWNCIGYYTDCSNCPAITIPNIKKIAQQNLELKKLYLPERTRLLVFSSNDFNRAKQSTLFKNKAIFKLPGYFVDETKYTPGSQTEARAFFDVPETHRVVFFGATSLNEKRKGMQLLVEALKHFKTDGVTFLVAGSVPPFLQLDGFKLVGNLTENQLVIAYQAADIFVCPTLEDSGPTMINQAIMCGTPVVSFDIGIGGDLVHTGKTGYLARFNDPLDLAHGINYLLNLPIGEFKKLRENCREYALSMYGGFESYKDKILALVNS